MTYSAQQLPVTLHSELDDDKCNAATDQFSANDVPVTGHPQTLHQGLTLIERQGLMHVDTLRRVRSDCVVAARVTGCTLDSLPSDPMLLRPLLARVLPARHRMTSSRWSSVKSSIARVLKLLNWHDQDSVLKAPVTADWERGRQQLPRKPQKAAFAALARYCDAHGIAPAAVTEATLAGYRR